MVISVKPSLSPSKLKKNSSKIMNESIDDN